MTERMRAIEPMLLNGRIHLFFSIRIILTFLHGKTAIFRRKIKSILVKTVISYGRKTFQGGKIAIFTSENEKLPH